jgi:cell division protein FtsL
MMRILHLLVMAALVSAAAYVYKIKFESTRQAERVAKLRTEIRQEQDKIADLRAQWSKLDTPMRIQELAKRHAKTHPIDARQFDSFSNLPERPPDLVPPDAADPIGTFLEEQTEIPTASIPPAKAKR